MPKISRVIALVSCRVAGASTLYDPGTLIEAHPRPGDSLLACQRRGRESGGPQRSLSDGPCSTYCPSRNDVAAHARAAARAYKAARHLRSPHVERWTVRQEWPTAQ